MSLSFRFCMHSLDPASMEQHRWLLSMLKSLPKDRDITSGKLWADISSGGASPGKIPFFRARR